MDTQKEILAYLHKQENKWVTSNELATFASVRHEPFATTYTKLTK